MKSGLLRTTAVAVIVAVIATVPTFAQQPETMTDEHVARIKSNCPGALATLSRIRTNDAPIYVNRNQTYFSISDKLMARLNSRLTLNRYDATQLVKTASSYNAELIKFRAAYKQYDDTMQDLLRMNCRQQPVSFYDKVAVARQQRQKVQETVIQLKALIDQYEQDVRTFSADHLSGGNKS